VQVATVRYTTLELGAPVEVGDGRIGDGKRAGIADYKDGSISRRQAVNVGSG
jgi:hypothetical protein